MHEKLKAIPKGIYKAEDCLEDIAGTDNLTWIRVLLKNEENGLTISFVGTDTQVRVPFNAVFG